MKNLKTLLFIGALALFGNMLWAQGVHLSPFVGYTFQNKFDISGGNAKLKDGTTYGATLAIPTSRNSVVEIMYSRQETSIEAYSIFFDEPFIRDAAMNYIMIGGSRVFPSVNDDLQYFGGMRVGAAVLGSQDDNFNTLTKFAAGVNLGFKYFLSDALGIHGGFNMNFPITDVGAGIGWSSSGGASVGVTGWSPIVQFTFAGGLSLRLGH